MAWWMQQRWGRLYEPHWINGAEVVAPPALGTILVATVSAGKKGRVYGVYIGCDDANDFRLMAGATIVRRYCMPKGGATHTEDHACPVADNLPSGTVVTIINISAGTTTYQASILYEED